MHLRTILAATSVAIALFGQAAAHEVTLGPLTLSDLWARATPPNAPTAGGFLTIANSGDSPDRLIAVSSPGVETGEIHQMAVTDGVMTMRPLEDGLEIPAHGTVTLAPGGFHLMFIGLQEPFVEGGDVPVTLTFANAGTIDTVLHVKGIGAKGPDGEHGHMDMKTDEAE